MLLLVVFLLWLRVKKNGCKIHKQHMLQDAWFPFLWVCNQKNSCGMHEQHLLQDAPAMLSCPTDVAEYTKVSSNEKPFQLACARILYWFC